MKEYIQSIAKILDIAAKEATAVPQVSLNQTIDLQDSYDIQENSINHRLERGEKLVGYKLGFTSKAKMEQMGVHEIIWGRLTDKMQYFHEGKLDRSHFIHPRIEPEIAFLVSKDIDEALTLENYSEYLAGVAGALEIIDSRYENFKFSLEDVIADNCSSSGFVLGPWLDPSQTVQDLGIKLEINGAVSQEGNSKAILGNPIESFVEMTRLAQKYDAKILKGHIILAGAATSAVYINSGDEITGHFDQIGQVQISVV